MSYDMTSVIYSLNQGVDKQYFNQQKKNQEINFLDLIWKK